ncbi:MAG: meaB [Cyanobacteria bacterium RYN_339]|nr:meaB [Cyanobacteria bacterium RYN_339]
MSLSDPASLAAGVLAGQARAIARAISWIEDEEAGAATVVAALYPSTGRALTVGITGPPGAGKSTFVDRLVARARAAGRKVGVIAVDPASPFTGGAILGDRVRVRVEAADPGVYFRSMSSRGHLGGIALATEAAVNVLDAAGFDLVIVETVGVGQSEIEVAQLADTTILVQPPGLGDGVQAVKAGIMEVPALFVINKADLPGAKQAAEEIRQYLGLVDPVPDAWQAPVLLVSATTERENGVDAVWDALERHWLYLQNHDRLNSARAARARGLLWREADRQLAAALRATAPSAVAGDLATAVAERRLSPAQAASELVRHLLP